GGGYQVFNAILSNTYGLTFESTISICIMRERFSRFCFPNRPKREQTRGSVLAFVSRNAKNGNKRG
ncbi:hypothetical protein, partial [Gardnerella vaginalis]|uniref:hypothetical protein n=1 Tax=Gardnerella vaginalis TaxID=2702 RepID=UPI00197AE0F5